MTSLLWLRRNLRSHDNKILYNALNSNSPIQPIFIFDQDILKDFTNKSDPRLSFIAELLVDLHQYFLSKNSGLIILYGSAREIIPRVALTLSVDNIYADEDFEPDNIIRDTFIKNCLDPENINLILDNDHLIINPRELKPYKVFTPYSKAWHSILTLEHYRKYEYALEAYADYNKLLTQLTGFQSVSPYDARSMLKEIGYDYTPHSLWKASDGPSRLFNFTNNNLDEYKIHRDYMGENKTSRISPYLRFGALSIREVLRSTLGGSDTYVNELIWRDFYTSIMHHFPYSIEKEFKLEYQSLKWKYNNNLFELFTQGKTGYPIVDAAINQLKTEYWMHNRSRMIVASFACKHLLIDWRLGEKFFREYLMDYELASNVGGWQWAASTGVDAQPYFRIFNPDLQTEKFDPDASYIKQFLPALQNVPLKYIANPLEFNQNLNYPAKIVNHKKAREEALAFFK